MNLVWWILWIIIILYIWVWIINNAFKNKKFKRGISLNIFVLSLLLVTFLYFYKDILIFVWLENLYLLEDNTRKTIWSFVIYCLSFIILLTVWSGNIWKKRSIKFIIISLLLFLGIWLWWAIMWINMLVMYYLVSSYAEEILKFSIWQNMFLKKQNNNTEINIESYTDVDRPIDTKRQHTDLIFFAIVAWLWFSVIENIFYLIVTYIWDGGTIILSVSRSIFATLLHVVATGLIAFFIVKNGNKTKLNKTNIFKIWLGILSGFALHGLYNLSLFYESKIITILILIICYFILTFLLFKSDLVYKKK